LEQNLNPASVYKTANIYLFDILGTFASGSSLLDHAVFLLDLEALLDHKVDVVNEKDFVRE
jgi:predicted nucleotidyltransferase